MNYETVPTDVLTEKDLNYLADMFEWNYLALKKTDFACDMVDDEEIISILEKACGLFDDNLNTTLNILESRGEVNE